MSLVLRVSPFSSGFSFGPVTFYGFQMIAETVNRGSLICAALRPVVILLGSLSVSSFRESNMTAV